MPRSISPIIYPHRDWGDAAKLARTPPGYGGRFGRVRQPRYRFGSSTEGAMASPHTRSKREYRTECVYHPHLHGERIARLSALRLLYVAERWRSSGRSTVRGVNDAARIRTNATWAIPGDQRRCVRALQQLYDCTCVHLAVVRASIVLSTSTLFVTSWSL